MNPTLAFDALLTDPRYAEVAAELQTMLPTWFRDQADASARTTSHMVDVLRDHIGSHQFGGIAPAEVPDWLRLSVLDALVNWITGRAEMCRHAPDPLAPQPVLAAAWRPGLVACAACAHLFRLRRGSDAEATCDACGHRCAGLEAGDGIHPAFIQAGSLLFQYGVCGSCAPPDASTASDDQ
jgi:hypothetical protein